jgi:hypothetical protein
MPTAIQISVNEKYWIKLYLQESYEIKVVDRSSCMALSTAIFKKTKINLSESTLRRLFGLMKYTNAFSTDTLNCIAFAVKFKDWEEFTIHVLKFDTNVINQNIHNYSRKLPNSSAVILGTLKKLPIETWIGAYQFQQIVNIAILNRDFELIGNIIKLPIDINNQHIYEHLVIGFQSFYFQSLGGDQKLIKFIQSHISSSILLQKCLLQAYVDENYINGFLGKWIEAITQNTLPDLLLFKYLVLCQKSYNEKDNKQAISYLEEALKESKQLKEIHPILTARIGVWSLILSSETATLETYFRTLVQPFDKADFLVIASRLIWMYRDEKEPISFLNEIRPKDFPTVKDFFQKGRYNVLLLTIAMNYLLQKDTVNAKKYFNLFNETDFAYDIVNIDFYMPYIEKLKALNS